MSIKNGTLIKVTFGSVSVVGQINGSMNLRQSCSR